MATKEQHPDLTTRDAFRSTPLPRILIVDHFDSYTLNLLALLATLADSDDELTRKVVVLPHTHPFLSSQTRFAQDLLPHFDAVILSPGPGTPNRKADFGFGLEFLKNAESYAIPTLGICLGHQGLAAAFGGRVQGAKSIQHGTQSELRFPDDHGAGIFEGVASGSRVTRYNSLTVEWEGLPDCLQVTAASDSASNVVPLPAVSEGLTSIVATEAGNAESKERCIMGLAHKSLPLWGVQFHPESIESQQGELMLRNFLRLCAEYHAGRASTPALPKEDIPEVIRMEGRKFVAAAHVLRKAPSTPTSGTVYKIVDYDFGPSSAAAPDAFRRMFVNDPELPHRPLVWLDSARTGDPQANFSYVAQPAFNFAQGGGASPVDIYLTKQRQWTRVSLDANENFWQYMDALQKELALATDLATTGQDDRQLRFRNGFVGYWGYEMKTDSLALAADETLSLEDKPPQPRAEFGFCNAVLQLDHASNRYTASVLVRGPDPYETTASQSRKLQQLSEVLTCNDTSLGLSQAESDAWAERVRAALRSAEQPSDSGLRTTANALPPLRPLDVQSDYVAKVEAARSLIAQGESYELCLTTQFVGKLSSCPTGTSDVFDLYLALRDKNPAPYAAFITLPEIADGRGRAILSTSPERFMSKSADGFVEMKPIKGTVPRAGYGRGEELSPQIRDSSWILQQDAERRARLEADPKERAENLMIVDLIRADLLSFCKPSTVKVPLLMQVESYETVHQLVTTVVGQTQESIGPFEALRRCFPPGSMTGAPKRRSVTLLERLEGKSRHHAEDASGNWKLQHRPRGVYSGALGWIGIDGATDFSVVIRTAVVDGDDVSIGAGGAVTYLSDAEREWQEVLDKVGALASVDLAHAGSG